MVGKFVCCDDNTLNPENMDISRFLVRTMCVNVLNESFKVNIDGVSFRIKLTEDTYGPLCLMVNPKSLKVGRADSSSSNSEEGRIFGEDSLYRGEEALANSLCDSDGVNAVVSETVGGVNLPIQSGSKEFLGNQDIGSSQKEVLKGGLGNSDVSAEDVLFSAGTVICCEPLVHNDLVKCNSRFWEQIDSNVRKKVWEVLGKVGWSFSGSLGASDGLIILWKEGMIEVISSFRGGGFLGIKICWKGLFDYIVNVYFPCVLSLKKILWCDLLACKSNFNDGEWCMGGDLNLCSGKRFSWFSGDGKAMSTIGRFLISEDMIERWGIISQKIGSRNILDHCPIWIIINQIDWVPKPFIVNNGQFDNKKFLPFVEKVWGSLEVSSRGDFVLKEKLRLLKEILRTWNRGVSGKVDLEIEEGILNVNKEDILLESCSGDQHKEVVRKRGKKEDEFYWFSFNGGGIVDSVCGVKEEVRRFVFEKFVESDFHRPYLDGIHFLAFSLEESVMLCLPFTKVDIKDVVWSCEGSKSPDSDGFNFLFIRKCWSLMKEDFFSGGRPYSFGQESFCGEFKLFMVGDNCKVDILQFPDDTLFIGVGIWRQVRALKSVLRGFKMVSGLGVNFHKSKLIRINISEHFLVAASNFLSCRIEKKSLLFLGISIGINPKRISSWNSLLLKIRNRLLNWKEKFISLGERVTLLKSVLSPLAIFLLSFYKAPVKVCKDIVKLQSNFLWGGVEVKKRIHWVGWDNVCLPSTRGGLGLKNIGEFNKALLLKWSYSRASSNSVWWNDIVGLESSLEDFSFPANYRDAAGNGISVSFWYCVWLGDYALKEKFPLLFSSVNRKYGFIVDMGI
ncbi:uncharacterized protein LOC131605433 [Vicia villosa]|uniref:uncharacterized protein LOC131605433 n=1 Tax=Vicia villosa TaxID=3911 RepID=UPI00273CB105|nr:uncharacterized protein LOC131605433 [Vicia villosa]